MFKWSYLIIGLFLWGIVIAYFVNEKSRRFVVWLLWDFSGLRFIWEKIRPPIEESTVRRKPATFVVWAFGIFGIYIVLFGIASQRYENRIDIIENRANAIFTQLNTPSIKKAISRIPYIQRMKTPVKPELMSPISVFHSLFSKDKSEYHAEVIELLKEIVEDWKDSLDSIDLCNAILQQVELPNANLHKAQLCYADLRGANLSNRRSVTHQMAEEASNDYRFPDDWLWVASTFRNQISDYGANLQGANLLQANLTGANLSHAILKNARLESARLKHAILSHTDFTEADLSNAKLSNSNLNEAILEKADLAFVDLSGIKGLKPEQLCRASSLYDAKLETYIIQQVKEKCPHLLEKPTENRD